MASSMSMRAAPPVVGSTCSPSAAFTAPVVGADPISLALQSMPVAESQLAAREAADSQRGVELGTRSGVTHGHVDEKDQVAASSVDSTTRYV